MQQLEAIKLAAPKTTLPIRVLHLWHLCSLDAPIVAVLWTLLVARAAHIHLPIDAAISLFLAVWMLYAADRLLDARELFANPLHHDSTLEARHLFHHRHARAFLTGIVLAAIAQAALLRHLLPAALRLYAILGTLLFAWFLLIHARVTRLRLPKELAVGLFFPAAAFIPTVARLPYLRPVMFPYALHLAAVCSLNCLAIYAWENPLPRAAAHWSTRYATRHLNPLATIIAIAGLTLAIISATTASQITLWPIALAASLSALTLLTLNHQHHRIHPLTLRAAADLALLTPILFLVWSPK